MNKTVWRPSANRTSLVFACLIASAQGPAMLSTTENGWEVDFTTQYRFRGTDQPFTSKLFRIGPRGLELADERASAGRDLDAVGTTYATNYRDSDGATSTSFTTPTATYRFDGQGQVSANGRWGVTWDSSGLYRVNLNTGHREVAGMSPGGLRSIASDGSVLAGQDGRLLLVRPDKTLVLPSFSRPYDAVLSDNGKFVAVDNGQFISLWSDGSDRFEPIAPGRRPFLSYDGTRLAWLGPGDPGTGFSQVWFCFTAACQPRRITSEPEGVTEIILNGNGGVALYVTGDSRVAGVDTSNGFRSQYLGPAPAITSAAYATVPGSAYEIRGTFPDDIEACVGGRCAIRRAVERHRFQFQFPWDTPSGSSSGPVVLRGGDVVWEALLHPRVDAFAPYAVTFAFHQDWRGPADETDPALPGETVHVYVLGLGPVDPPVLTGMPSPASPLSRCALPLTFVGAPGLPNPARPTYPAEVQYAGLAPGLVGIYQVDFTIPANWTDRLYDFSVLGPTERGPQSIALVHVRVTP